MVACSGLAVNLIDALPPVGEFLVVLCRGSWFCLQGGCWGSTGRTNPDFLQLQCTLGGQSLSQCHSPQHA